MKMADFFSMVKPMAGNMIWIIIILIIAVILGGIAFGFWFFIKNKKVYNRDVIIFRRKSNEMFSIEFDKGGYVKTPNKDWKFKLQKNKTYIEGDYKWEIPKEYGGNIIFLYRDKGNNYFHCEPSFNMGTKEVILKDKNDVPLLDEQGKPKTLIISKLDVSITSEDVEQAKQMYLDFINAFTKKDMWATLIPIIGMAVFVVLVIVLIYILISKFDVLQQVASSLVEAAKLLKDNSCGIVSNAPI